VKLAEIRDKDADGLTKHEAELRKELFNLRFQAVMGTLANPARVRQVRREIARVRTVMNEKAGA